MVRIRGGHTENFPFQTAFICKKPLDLLLLLSLGFKIFYTIQEKIEMVSLSFRNNDFSRVTANLMSNILRGIHVLLT